MPRIGPIILCFGLLPFLAGCVEETNGGGDSSAPDLCGAKQQAGLVGQPVARLPDLSGGGPVRIIHPGQPVTQDYAPGRLNIIVGKDGIIGEIWCG
ncbi:MAG: I78 family peptidase inhibitor [Paracoccaceae bacterium]